MVAALGDRMRSTLATVGAMARASTGVSMRRGATDGARMNAGMRVALARSDGRVFLVLALTVVDG